MIDEHDAVISPDRSLRTSDLIGRQDRRTVLRRVIRHSGNPVGAYANLMFRRADYEAIGGMPRHVPWIAHDLALVLALLACGDFYGIDETLVDFRIAAGSSSARESSAGVAEQVAYIERLRRDEHALLRPRDILYSRMRMPLMQLRHRMIVAAAGPHNSLRTKLARRLLGLTGSTVGTARIGKSSRSRRPTP